MKNATKQKTPQRARGDAAEQAAAQFLRESGLEIIAQNYQCRFGEIDLICHDSGKNHDPHHENTLVFVEVRLRTNRHGGTGAESVTRAKQQKITKAALDFLQHHPLSLEMRNSAMRFDVLSVSGQPYRFEWFQEAFYPGDG